MMVKKIYNNKMEKGIIIFLGFIVIIIISQILLYKFNIIPHKQYDNKDFNIETYVSNVDKDNDGIDDQTDILNSVREYIQTKPKYKSKYYQTGYPNDEYGEGHVPKLLDILVHVPFCRKAAIIRRYRAT